MAILHKAKTVDVLAPQYQIRFRCVGPDCPDNCCTGWTVSIDKKTHNAYHKITSVALAPRLQSALHRTRGAGGDAHYSRIEMIEGTGSCPFMEEHLCAIQRDLGEDKLSHTCFSYPRSTHEVAGVRQQALTLSCPEAARLALESKSAMDFTMSSSTIRDQQITVIGLKDGLSAELMNRVRFFSIQLMRGEGMALWERMAALGLMCESIGDLLKARRSAGIEPALDELARVISAGEARVALEGLTPDHTAQALVFTQLWASRKTRAIESPTQRQVQDQVMRGLGFDVETGEAHKESLIDRYRSGLFHLRNTITDSPAVIENYLVNEMFREIFPFGDETLLAHYNRLVVRYGILRLMMVGRCLELGRSLTLQEAVETVQVFARCYQHNAGFASGANHALSAANWHTLEKVFRFLRD